MLMTTATIISGILAAGGLITSTAMNNKATKTAAKESKELALIARQDDIDNQEAGRAVSMEALAVERESLGLKKKELATTTAMSNKAMRQNQLNTLGQTLDVMSQKDKNMTNFVLSLYGKAGAK